jgi:hypothetical protein
MAKPIPKMSFSEIGEGLKNIDMSLSLGKHSLYIRRIFYHLKIQTANAKDEKL